jgi:hypothetical protein
MNPDLRRRIRVLRLRQRVEMCSWRVFTACLSLPERRPHHTRVERRLTLLTAWAGETYDYPRLSTAATQLTWVYIQCCDVLHGRRAFTDPAEPLVRGWEEIVANGEGIVAACCREPGINRDEPP